jgi:hypothetical protein
MNTITPGTWARVRLHPDCPGDDRRPHHPAEENCRVEVTAVNNDGDHSVLALYMSGGKSSMPHPPGGVGIGRYFRPDELEPCDPPW